MGGVERESMCESEHQQCVWRPAGLPLYKDVDFPVHFWHEGCCPWPLCSLEVTRGRWEAGKKNFHAMAEYHVPYIQSSSSQHPYQEDILIPIL